MRKLLLISISLLIAGGVFAEQKVCEISPADLNDDAYYSNYFSNSVSDRLHRYVIQNCEAGDVLSWVFYSWDRSTESDDEILVYSHAGQDIVGRYCHQEKQITVTSNFGVGVCTFTGKGLEFREEKK